MAPHIASFKARWYKVSVLLLKYKLAAQNYYWLSKNQEPLPSNKFIFISAPEITVRVSMAFINGIFVHFENRLQKCIHNKNSKLITYTLVAKNGIAFIISLQICVKAVLVFAVLYKMSI